MATVSININYDNDPPITKNVRDNVEAIFKKCFDSLETDKVAFAWKKGLAGKDKLGKTDFDVSTGGHIAAGNGETAGHVSTLDMDHINNSSALEPGDPEITTANTIAHEIGFHAICGESDPIAGDKKDDDIVDRYRCTRKLTKELGKWTPDVCAAMKKKLGVK